MKVFEAIYQRNLWNGVESMSGPGSGWAPTRPIAQLLLELSSTLHATSVLNIGCGDDLWTPYLPGYLGVDASPTALTRARAIHPDRLYALADATLVELPPFELVIMRDVIQHLSWDNGALLLKNIKNSGSRWLLASTYPDSENIDIADGEFFSPDLEVDPYNLGEPDQLYLDGYSYDDTLGVRDPNKMLGLWDLHAA